MSHQRSESSEARVPSPVADPSARIVVLLVDDQRFIGLAVARLIAGVPDIELHCCESAIDAIARANALNPKIILQDLVMPGIDGLTLVRQFRQNPATANTPIVMLSGNEDPESRAKSLAAGAADYLLKLPGREELIGCIRKLAGDGGCRATATASGVAPAPGSEKTLDLEIVAMFCEPGGGLSTFGRRLVEEFITDAGLRITALRNATGDGTAESLRAMAHSLKGSSLTMGAIRLGGLCRRIEQQLDEDPRVSVSTLVTAIEDEFVLVRKALGNL